MEKYRKFADPATGINPWLPPKSKTSGLVLVLKFIYGPILVLLRLPFVLLLTSLLFLYHGLLRNLIVIKGLKRGIDLMVNFVLFRTILLISGFYRFNCNLNFFAKDTSKIPRMHSGEIILCNQTSPIDVLYFSYLTSPVFVKLIYQPKPLGTQALFAPLSFKQSLKYAFSSYFRMPVRGDEAKAEGLSGLDLKSLGELCTNEKRGPIVIFFEGAMTNGAGILELNEFVGEELRQYGISSKKNQMLFSLKYGDGQTSTIRSQVWQYILNLANVYNSVDVTLVTAKTGLTTQTFIKQIHEMYAEIHKLKKIGLSYEDYKKFMDYWRSTSQKDYVNKSKNE